MSKSREIKGLSVLYLIAIVGTILSNSTFVLKDITHVLKDVSPALQSTSHDTKEIYFVWFDFFPALFIFLNGLTFSIAFKNKRISTTRLSGHYSRRGLEALSLLIAVGSSFAGNLDFPIYPLFEGLEMSNSVVKNLVGFIFFNGYYSFLPWIAFFTFGMSIGKGDLRVRGWLPPISIIGIVLVIVGFLLEAFLKKIYGDIPTMGVFRLNVLEWRMHSLSFAMVVAGFCLVVTNLVNFWVKQWFNSTWFQKIWAQINLFASAKYTLYFLVVSETIVIFSVVKYGNHPIFWFRPAYILIPLSLVLLVGSFFLTSWWRKRVNQNTPIEWLLKNISGSRK
jgi:hypothetical protein